jgi:hypothetical protein
MAALRHARRVIDPADAEVLAERAALVAAIPDAVAGFVEHGSRR